MSACSTTISPPTATWIEMPDYGWGWAPRVERGWRPYTRGQWVMTDDGWFWDSDEQFGWAAYHYGRWINDPYYGWIWIPGTEWAPAWVSWRHGHGYTGWAPLPPRVTWRTRIGLSIGGLEIDAFIGADDYAFVSDRAFVDRGVYQRLLPPAQNVSFLKATNNVTNYSYANDRIVNGGIPVAAIAQAVGRSVPRVRTVDVDRANAPRSTRAGEIAIFRPMVNATPARRPAQGRSLVKGEQPPPLLVERRTVREQERRQKGNAPALTAKDAQQQQANQQRANQATAAQAQTDRRAKDAQQQQMNEQRANQQQVNQQKANQQHVDQQQANQQQVTAAGEPAAGEPAEGEPAAR